MNIINRRNAFVGWIVWQVGTRVIKRKAKAAVPAIDSESKRPNRSLIALALAGAGAAAYFLFLRGDGDDTDSFA